MFSTETQKIYREYRERTDYIAVKYQCSCTNGAATRCKLVNGVIHVWLQCRDCGQGIRSLRKADYDVDSLPWFDEQKRDERHENAASERESTRLWLNCELEQLAQGEAAANEESDLAWWKGYKDYLRSKQWYVMRQKVLKRDANLCQACLSRKATQVHHLSYVLYNQIGYSAAFECVAICLSCHEKIHPRMAEAQHSLMGYNPYLNGATNGHR